MIGGGEESPFTQLRADRRKVIAADVANQRDLAGGMSSLDWPSSQIERRVGEVGERDEIDRAGADDAGNRAHLLHLRVDERDAAVEVLVAEQGRLEGQEPSRS